MPSGTAQRMGWHAVVETGGNQVGTRGYFYAPTVLSGLKHDDEQIQTEIFGPVMTVQKFGLTCTGRD